MSSISDIAKENCRTCLSYFNEDNGKCSLMNCSAISFDKSRIELMKTVMDSCSVTLFPNKDNLSVSEEVFICMSCVTEMDQMLNFLQKCIHSQMILKQASEVKTEIHSSTWIDEGSKGEENAIQPKVEIKVEGFHQEVEGHSLNGFHSDAVSFTATPHPPTHSNNEEPEHQHQQSHNAFPPAHLSLTFHKHCSFKSHTCVICHENFTTLQLIKKHMAAKHDNGHSLRHSCSQCSQVFPSKYHLNLHRLKMHNLKKYSCGVCKWTFASVSSLKFHENIHLRQKTFSCSSCSKSFASASVLREHRNRFHCGRSLNRKKKLDLHVESLHEKKDKSRRYSCPDCHKKFQHPYSLKNHLNTHLGIKPFLCSACGSAFTALSNLTSHLRRIHSSDKRPNVKKYLCHTCGDSFARAAHLQRHTLRKHVPNAEKKYECPVCKKKFLEKSDVTGHVKLHDDVKPFVCDECSKCFRTAWRLQAHIKRVHLGLRPFECPTCTVRFKTKSHLEKHIRTHTGEKPFPCPHCSYTCAEKSNLKKHINIHLKAM